MARLNFEKSPWQRQLVEIKKAMEDMPTPLYAYRVENRIMGIRGVNLNTAKRILGAVLSEQGYCAVDALGHEIRILKPLNLDYQVVGWSNKREPVPPVKLKVLTEVDLMTDKEKAKTFKKALPLEEAINKARELEAEQLEKPEVK
jgi:hypothetical protein